MLRLQRFYHALPAVEKANFVMKDRAILKSMRLSFLWAAMKVQLDSPHVVAMGLVGVAGLVTEAALFCCKYFFNLAH